ncbi:hypothetical protein SAMN04489724_0451 [Algoriphagus locisalis]|uniref:Effector-binding domain-containing protein n=1 Tax=Algoriphagus locisalis TaxID=305507 RepID=A0A1I6XFG9_9BACT|nr:hypothetical protein [Algoriphagus locisalis]SFT37049.1 hypothetical protein SAMN04489724_0451 [Algoriphagus locisalis]
MLTKNSNKYILAALALVLFTVKVSAQKVGDEFRLNERVDLTPDGIISNFQEMGMDPVNHILTIEEQEIVEQAFDVLPPVHQEILKEHLHSISFLDNMPNTALTSPVGDSEDTKMFTITFRAEILQQTISEWATWKEQGNYEPNSDVKVIVDAGDLNAMVYILLHEATHVVDAVLGISPKQEKLDSLSTATGFTLDTWSSMNAPTQSYRKTILEKTRFRGGGPVSMTLAPEVYQSLAQTPFVSLYGMASWFEDLAELTTIHHLTNKLDQPYQIQVVKQGVEVFHFEPMESKEVQQRIYHLDLFYRN